MAKKKTTKKTTAKRKPTPKPKVPAFVPTESDIRRTIDLWIHGALGEETTIIQLGNDDKARAIFEAARARIHQTARFDRELEIGSSIDRLRRIIALSMISGDLTVAVSAQTQLNKLLALFPSPGAGEGSEPDPQNRDELQAIADHLRPLGLAPATYPLEGVARIAADTIRQLQAKGDQ